MFKYIIRYKQHAYEDHLLPCPERHGFQERGAEELHSPHLVCQASVDERSVLIPREETAADGHAGAGHHVVLNQAGQRLPILQKGRRPMKGFPKSHTVH